jgi:hypothetical protein
MRPPKSAGQTATWTGTASGLIERDGTSIVNNGRFAIQASGDLDNSGKSGVAVSFLNNGTLSDNDSGTTFPVQGVAFTTTAPGTVAVPSGTPQLQGGGTETGASFSIASHAGLEMGGSAADSTADHRDGVDRPAGPSLEQRPQRRGHPDQAAGHHHHSDGRRGSRSPGSPGSRSPARFRHTACSPRPGSARAAARELARRAHSSAKGGLP